MKTYWHLRVKLFVWIGGLFALVFLGAILLEKVIIGQKLQVSEAILYKELRTLHDQKRRRLQALLEKKITESQARLDALLQEIKETFPKKNYFYKMNDRQIWNMLASIVLEDPWLSYLQLAKGRTGRETQVFSLNLSDVPIEPISSYEINQELSWVFVKDRLYITMLLPDSLVNKIMGKAHHIFHGKKLRAAYDWKTLLHLQGLEKGKTIFEKRLLQVKRYLQSKEELLRKENFRELLKSSRKKKFSRKTSLTSKTRRDSFYQDWEKSFRYFLRESQILAIAEFATRLSENPSMQDGPLSSTAPAGFVYSELADEKQVFLSMSSLFSHSAISDKKLFSISRRNPRKGDLFPRDIHLQKQLLTKDLFLTKQAELFEQDSSLTSVVTVASSLDPGLKKLAEVSRQHVLLIQENQVLAVYDPFGEKQQSSFFYDIDPKKFQRKQMDGITFRDGTYYFLRFDPFPKTAISVVLLEPFDKAFSILDHLKRELRRMVSEISRTISINSFMILLIALVILEIIARKITRPVTRLATASQKIREGQLHEVDLPNVEKGSSKEVVSLLTSFSSMVKDLAEKEKVRSILNKVVSKEVAAELLKKELHLGGEMRKVVVLFADIRNFTKITEHMEPTRVIEIINTCMTKLTAIIERHSGVVDKYIGDQVMALFGAPFAVDTPYYLAIKTALEMQLSLKSWNEERKKQKEPLIEVGIGVHGGKVLAGNMGAEDRLNYTVFGANVNLAARLCKNAPAGDIFITETSLSQENLADKIEVEAVERKMFKGFSRACKVYRVLGRKPGF